MTTRRRGLTLVCLLALIAAAVAFARAGGGQTYGGSNGSSGSGGSSGGGSGLDADDVELIYYLVRFFFDVIFHYPQFGVPLVIVLVLIGMYLSREDASAPATRLAPAAARATLIQNQVERLRERDPNFSRPLFLDFVSLLYARAIPARASGDVAPVAPYLKPALASEWQQGASRRTAIVDQVVVGAIRITALRGQQRRVYADVEIDASYRRRKDANAEPEGTWTTERWTLERAAEALSKTPEEIAKLGCPSCGAPCELKPDGRCTYCDQVVTKGDFAWQVVRAHVQTTSRRPDESALVSMSGVEAGTSFPTLFAPDLDAQRRAFGARHPDFDMAAFERLARETFFAIQQAWTSGDYAKARPFETDNLYNTHRYWLEMYQAAGLRNVLEDLRIDRIETAKIEVDAFYEAITVRIFATAKDYTLDAKGELRSGSKTQPRSFSEYWTFIAAIGAPVTKGPSETSCPSCGAPVKLSQAGKCEHCDALVTSGRFGWILSRIEQDESYAG